MSAIETFLMTVQQIERLAAPTYADAFRRLPSYARQRVADLTISSRHGIATVTQNDLRAASELREGMTKMAVAEAIADRNRALSRIANELEMLRRVLPTLAAEAAIELGVLARAIAEEAKETTK
jgi:hypothetical protein